MVLSKYTFDKKCDFDLCQNKADYVLSVGAKGNLLMCSNCMDKLRNVVKRQKGEINGKN